MPTDSSSPPPTALAWLARGAIVAAILLVFGRLVAFGPINWDDRETIFANPILLGPPGDALAWAWTRPHLSLWIPATHTLWTLLAQIGATTIDGRPAIDPVPFRVASVLLHAISALLVFAIARRLLRGALLPATVAAAVFALHPLQVESVAWISGQKDLLAGALTFAAVYAALRWLSEPTGVDRAANADPRPSATTLDRDDASKAITPRSRWAIATYAFAIAAMLAKPSAVTIVVMLPLALLAGGVTWRRAVRATLPLLPAALIVAVIAKLAQPAALVEPVALPWRPIVMLDAIGFYVGKIFWPATLALDYGRSPARATVGGALVGLVAIAGVVTIVWRRLPLVAIGSLIALAGLTPVLGLVPFEFQRYSTVADHYLYASMLGVSLIAGACVARWPRVAGVAAMILIVGYAIRSAARVPAWRDTTSIMRAELDVYLDSLAATRVLAFEASSRGDDATAIALLRRAVDAHDDAQAMYNLANALERVGDRPAARAMFEAAIARRPDLLPARYNLALWLIKAGDLDAAEAQLEEAARHAPENPVVANALRTLRMHRAATRPS